ncbi:class I SAM-dependent methyltransferase [Kribbella kalugense]|uniref:Methyltransferase family protein n=1 Tax=Kribbella kalugense TaxID=2512221 RepID=A0A4R7ZMD7_9ACTN|nr:class I SAM-dependent methyltransferase [Kribbella kalugense]TDW18999.1 methyltransferase family protein [Kribbella kalugense]
MARIYTVDQLLEVLDQVVSASGRGDRSEASAAEYWTGLLTTPGHPLATQLPDEPLVDWHDRGLLGDLSGARVLDVGCGGARNTRWLAEQGATVHGIDLATDLLDTLRPTMPAEVTLTALDVLRDPLPEGPFDLVYDSGCFHHIAPHRRITYLQRVLPLVRPGGRFAIVTFAAEQMETPSDLDVVTTGDTYGGMTFSLDDLRTIFGTLTPVELRAVNPDRPNTFAPNFLNAALFTTK